MQARAVPITYVAQGGAELDFGQNLIFGQRGAGLDFWSKRVQDLIFGRRGEVL